jgi:hypothetical protein
MAAPYPWIKDSGTISGAPTGRLAITSTSGLYLSTSTNSSILGPTNTDLSIESVGTGDIILKTNSNNRLTINESGDITSEKNLIINNPSIGGGAYPLLTLNLTNTSGTIVQEVYNQKTAAAGTSIYDFFCNAKDSNNNKIKYANINVLTSSIISTSSRGDMTFSIKDSTGNSPSPYLRLDGLNSRVTIPNQLAMQNNILMGGYFIENCSEITTPLGNKYTPQLVQYLTGNGTFTATGENNMRQVLVNTIPATISWIDSGVNIFNGSSSEDTTASAIFQGNWWVGTQQGNLYYSSDGGSSWTSWPQGNVGGPILVLYPFNGGNYLAVGGSFNSPYSCAFYLDTGLNANDFTNGNGGFNADVYTFCENTSYSILYIGGRFSGTLFGGSFGYGFEYWYNWDYNSFQGYVWDAGNSTGFVGGSVRTIVLDSNSGLIIVGGEFTDFKGAGLSYLTSFQLFGYSLGGYWGFGFIPNNIVTSVVPYSSGVLIGGNFINPITYMTWNTNFSVYAIRNGSWDLYDYPFFSPSNPIRRIFFFPNIGTYYTILDTEQIYQDGTLLPTIPTGNVWLDIFYNNSITTFATDAQSSVGFPFYILNISTSITVNLSGATVVYGGGQFSSNITLFGQGSVCETQFNSFNNRWYVLSTTGTVQFN